MLSSLVIQLAVVACLSLLCCTPFTTGSAVERPDHDQAEGIIRQMYAASQVKGVHKAGGAGLNAQSKEASCQCIDYNCGCCAHLFVPEIKLDNTCCVNMSYLPNEFGIAVVFTVDKLVIINITVSAKNPPPICFGIPYLEKAASICLHFYDIDWSDKTLSGCIRLEAHLVYIFVKSFNLGCFHFPIPGGGSDGLETERRVAKLVAALREHDSAGRGY
jgi:hypothetical protein